ncbi:MAG: hypothetical protein KGJ84_14095 [Elusimicrobia bacterium]|nr:hypothetical protein [Elusimicrobiota bacterium]
MNNLSRLLNSSLIALLLINFPVLLNATEKPKGSYCRIDEKSGYDLEFVDAKGNVTKSIERLTLEQERGRGSANHYVRVHGCKKGKFAYVVDWLTLCGSFDEEGLCDPKAPSDPRAIITGYDASGKQRFQIKKKIRAGSEDNLKTSANDEMAVFLHQAV